MAEPINEIIRPIYLPDRKELRYQINQLSGWLFNAIKELDDGYTTSYIYDKNPGLAAWFSTRENEIKALENKEREEALALLTPRQRKLLGIK